MLNRKIYREKWQKFFDRLSKNFRTDGEKKYVNLRLFMPEKAGTMDLARWLPLYGITYDPKEDILHVILEGITHRARPLVIWASADPDGNYERFLVLCRDGSRVSISLSDYAFPRETLPYDDPFAKSREKARVFWNELRRFIKIRRGNDIERREDRQWPPVTEKDSEWRGALSTVDLPYVHTGHHDPDQVLTGDAARKEDTLVP